MLRSLRTVGAAFATVVMLAPDVFCAQFAQVIGAVSPEGTAVLVRHFQVPGGSIVAGVEFYSNDLETTFPTVAILQGTPESAISEAVVLATANDVSPGNTRHIVVNCAPFEVASPGNLLVAIHLPASDGVHGPGDGAGIGAHELTGETTSYFASEPAGALGAMDVEYGIALVVNSLGKATTDAAHAAPDERSDARETFLNHAPIGTRSSVQVEFGVAQSGRATLGVYNVAGRRIFTLVDGLLAAGVHHKTWDWRDQGGTSVAAGVYLLRLDSGQHVITRKLVRAK